jgi:hypothetical protein
MYSRHPNRNLSSYGLDLLTVLVGAALPSRTFIETMPPCRRLFFLCRFPLIALTPRQLHPIAANRV